MLEFMDVMESEHERHAQYAEQSAAKAQLRPGPRELMRIDGMTCRLPHGRLIVDKLNLVLERGTNVVIQGPSGCGKTSLLRYIRGLWHLKKDMGHVATQLQIGTG